MPVGARVRQQDQPFRLPLDDQRKAQQALAVPQLGQIAQLVRRRLGERDLLSQDACQLREVGQIEAGARLLAPDRLAVRQRQDKLPLVRVPQRDLAPVRTGRLEHALGHAEETVPVLVRIAARQADHRFKRQLLDLRLDTAGVVRIVEGAVNVVQDHDRQRVILRQQGDVDHVLR